MTTYVESYIYPHYSKVAPMMAIKNIRIRLQECVRGPVRTELATVRSAWIRDVTAKIADVLAQVLLACLARRWCDRYIFDGGACDPRAPGR
jgi:hypothetical protein